MKLISQTEGSSLSTSSLISFLNLAPENLFSLLLLF
jgi:hypothetical protein